MKIVFMGTAEFAVPALALLLEHDYNVVGVVTATDKMGGRGGKKLLQSAVKKFAVEKGLNILQPKNLKAAAFQEDLRALEADLQVVVAFRMLPKAVWNMPPMGTMNVHGSLLPKYRGAAPIHWAVINGEMETGVSSFLLKHEIDTGDVLFQAKTPISEEDTTGDVYERLMHLGANLALQSVQSIEIGNFKCQPQNQDKVTHAPKIYHDDCKVNFDQTTTQVHNFIRGMSPFPTAWTILAGEKLKIFRTEKELVEHNNAVGSVHSDGKRELKIATQDGYIYLLDVQLTKRKRMDVKSFLNGYKVSCETVD